MVGIVIASHGVFCEGLKSSTEMIGGTIAQCTAVALQPGEDPDAYGERLCKAVDQMDDGHGVLMLIDLRGGTPFNRVDQREAYYAYCRCKSSDAAERSSGQT